MEKNRIQINGEWYVKENTLPQTNNQPIMVTPFFGAVTEDDVYCVEYTVLLDEEGHIQQDISSIQITHKIPGDGRENWVEDLWDNSLYLEGIREGTYEEYEDKDSDKIKLTPHLFGIIKELLNTIHKEYTFLT